MPITSTRRRTGALLAALVPALLGLASPALADDPNDPAMRSAAARARDREMIRQLNLAQLAHVRQRDARYAEGWAAWRAQNGPAGAAAGEGYAARTRDHRQAMAEYDQARADYDRRMAAWRRQVAACNAGDYDACR